MVHSAGGDFGSASCSDELLAAGGRGAGGCCVRCAGVLRPACLSPPLCALSDLPSSRSRQSSSLGRGILKDRRFEVGILGLCREPRGTGSLGSRFRAGPAQSAAVQGTVTAVRQLVAGQLLRARARCTQDRAQLESSKEKRNILSHLRVLVQARIHRHHLLPRQQAQSLRAENYWEVATLPLISERGAHSKNHTTRRELDSLCAVSVTRWKARTPRWRRA